MTAPLFHVGIVVSDIAEAMAELTEMLGVTWQEPHESSYDEWRITVAYSRTGPPFIELIQGEPGGPWDTTHGSHIDHIGFLSPDVDGEARRLVSAGWPISVDGARYDKPGVFSYHTVAALGARVELVNRDAVARFFDSAEPGHG